MLFFLIPLILNPFGFIIRWLPALYLAAWPIIVQTIGRDAIMLQAILLIMFILACDVTREIMLKVFGFDFISLPAGIGLLAFLLSDKGTALVTFITPICSTLLVVIEPVFLFVESFILMDMLKVFNKWISKLSNVRDNDSHDLSSWEPPLSRTSIVMRFVVILITISSYLASFMLIQESKMLLGYEVPIQFNQAIAMLVTLQLIALTGTIYREEGILSQSAMTALVATVPIFIASWSYYHINTNAASTKSGLSLSWPFWGRPIDKLAEYFFGPDFWYILGARLVFLVWWLASTGTRADSTQATSHIPVSDYDYDDGGDESCIHTLKRKLRRLNSWLPINKTTLIKILFVLAYAQMLIQQTENRQNFKATGSAGSQLQESLYQLLGGGGGGGGGSGGSIGSSGSGSVGASKDYEGSDDPIGGAFYGDGVYFGFAKGSGSDGEGDGREAPSLGLLDSSAQWLACMWNSAKSCCSQASSASAFIGGHSSDTKLLTWGQYGTNRASRLLEAILAFTAQLIGFLVGILAYAYDKLINVHALLHTMHGLWLVRWRSPIIQRLMQSVFIHLHYICSLILAKDDDDNDDVDSGVMSAVY